MNEPNVRWRAPGVTPRPAGAEGLGSDRRPIGVASSIGVQPTAGFRYDGFTWQDCTMTDVQVVTSHDAIEQVILPPPLTADRDVDPLMVVKYGWIGTCRGWDGRPFSYQVVRFDVPCRYEEMAGSWSWEYCDGVFGDKHHLDLLVSWGIHYGMPKPIADISFSPDNTPDGGQFMLTVDRRGSRLVDMRYSLDRKLSDEEVAEFQPIYPAAGPLLKVREIPTANVKGYTDRSIVYPDPPRSMYTRIRDVWETTCNRLDFGWGELDPLSELPINEILGAQTYVVDGVTSDLFTHSRLVAQLEGDAQLVEEPTT